MGTDSGHHYCERAGHGGAPPLDDRRREISQPAAAGCARIGPANTAAAATLGRRILSFFGHSRPTHTYLPPFLDPMNSFPWSFSPDSSSFERYDKKKFGLLLDRVFRPPQQPLDQGKGTDGSWSIGLFIDMWFVNFGRRLVSFPFLRHLG